MIGRELLDDHLLRIENALRDSAEAGDTAEQAEARQLAADAIAGAREWRKSSAAQRGDWNKDRYVAAFRDMLAENARLRLEIEGTPDDHDELKAQLAAVQKELAAAHLELRNAKKQRDDFSTALRQERRQREALENIGKDRSWNDPTQQRGEGAILVPEGMKLEAVLDAVEQHAEDHPGDAVPNYGGIFSGGVFETPGRLGAAPRPQLQAAELVVAAASDPLKIYQVSTGPISRWCVARTSDEAIGMCISAELDEGLETLQIDAMTFSEICEADARQLAAVGAHDGTPALSLWEVFLLESKPAMIGLITDALPGPTALSANVAPGGMVLGKHYTGYVGPRHGWVYLGQYLGVDHKDAAVTHWLGTDNPTIHLNGRPVRECEAPEKDHDDDEHDATTL